VGLETDLALQRTRERHGISSVFHPDWGVFHPGGDTSPLTARVVGRRDLPDLVPGQREYVNQQTLNRALTRKRACMLCQAHTETISIQVQDATNTVELFTASSVR
jgi:hypothetical protein